MSESHSSESLVQGIKQLLGDYGFFSGVALIVVVSWFVRSAMDDYALKKSDNVTKVWNALKGTDEKSHSVTSATPPTEAEETAAFGGDDLLKVINAENFIKVNDIVSNGTSLDTYTITLTGRFPNVYNLLSNFEAKKWRVLSFKFDRIMDLGGDHTIKALLTVQVLNAENSGKNASGHPVTLIADPFIWGEKNRVDLTYKYNLSYTVTANDSSRSVAKIDNGSFKVGGNIEDWQIDEIHANRVLLKKAGGVEPSEKGVIYRRDQVKALHKMGVSMDKK